MYKLRRAVVTGLAAVMIAGAAGIALAQTPTATISGHVTDKTGLPVPGASVTITSANLQGPRATATSQNGDYIFKFVPPGEYDIVFVLAGFGNITEHRTVAASQVVTVNATLNPAVTESVTVVAESPTLTNTPQAATSIKQQLIPDLPTNRTLLSAVNLSPAVHDTGPSGNTTIAGAMSYDNLFTVNGVVVADNIRGTPNNLFIEDAIQETTIVTSGVSAEYGRFGGGIINAITKSGGNRFTGSFRTTLNNDNWRALVSAFTNCTTPPCDTKTNTTVPTYEATVGGPIIRDQLWFFDALRYVNSITARNTAAATNIPYKFTDKEKRIEAPKLTATVWNNHTIKAAFTKVYRDQLNNRFTSNILDLNSLTNRHLPQDLLSVNYSGVLSSTFFIEGQYSQRHFSFIGDGATSTDLVNGTLLLDRSRNNARYWSPTFCGVCDPERRDNHDILVKGSYFASTSRGSHNTVFGYDLFNDQRFANNHQSGSDYRIFGTRATIAGTTVFPVFDTGTSTFIRWTPIFQGSEGTNFRTHSAFFNDVWQVNPHLSLSLGVRWDKNSGKDSVGRLVADDSNLSPRLGLIWDPRGSGQWTVNASYARYVTAIANSVADSTSPGGQPAAFDFNYQGPPINVTAATVATADAVKALFDWFFANGGTSRPLRSAPSIPGVSSKINGSLNSPHVNEFVGGMSHALGTRGAVRADVVYRRYRDFYADRIDTTTGKVTNSSGQTFDLDLVQNTNAVFRKYIGLHTQASYRWGNWLQVGGNYTLSHTSGNFDGETVASGPVSTGVLSFPEYKQAAWNYPPGDLAVDQRHRIRLYGVWTIAGGLSISGIEQIGTGTPYGAAQAIDDTPFVTNPGYINPPANAITYFFTPRDQFRTATLKRFDFAANYHYRFNAGVWKPDLFIQAQFLNLFNRFQLADINNIDTTVLDASNPGGQTFTKFNPFSSTPVQGVGNNWEYGTNFGKALTRFAYTLPRTFILTFGVRF